MAYTCPNYHIVYSTKDRAPLNTPDIQQRLYEYSGGVARERKCRLLAAGGIADHVHLLISAHTSIAPMDLIRDIKANSSRWIHETFPAARDFAWQDGYGAFTVSASGLDTVRRYIDNQETRHRTMTFEEEFIRFLEKHGIEYDPRYVFA